MTVEAAAGAEIIRGGGGANSEDDGGADVRDSANVAARRGLGLVVR